MNQSDIPIFAADLMLLLNIKHTNTLRLKINAGQVPPPDVRLNQKMRWWYRESLVAAGLLKTANQPNPEVI